MTTAREIAESGQTGAEAAKAATDALNSLTATRMPPLSDLRAEAAGEAVDHPAHYGGEDDPFEAIKIIEHYDLGFRTGNAVKYLLRAGRKPGASYLQDLEKAAWYLQREIERAKQ